MKFTINLYVAHKSESFNNPKNKDEQPSPDFYVRLDTPNEREDTWLDGGSCVVLKPTTKVEYDTINLGDKFTATVERE